MSSLIPMSVDYTDKDFDSIDDRLARLIRSVFPTWTDFNVLSFGNILKESFAFVGDVLTFYQDAQAGESRMLTATQRRSVIALAKLIGFELPGATAATVDVKLSLDAPPVGTVTIPAGDVVRTEEITEAIEFQLLTDAVIAALADPPEVTVTVENSESQEEVFSSSGLADQSFLLARTPFLDGSLDGLITTGQGAWDEVDDFLESGPTDRHFTVDVDQNDRARVTFGDGTNGLIPIGTITMVYKTGGGAAGNVEAEAIKVVRATYQDSLGNPVRVSVINEEAASGGAPRMSVALAKIRAPQSLRVLNRTVAREDYEINATRVPGVARALMLTSDQDPGLSENSGILRVIPEGGGTPSSAMLDDVRTMVTETYPNTVTFFVLVAAPIYKEITVQATVYLRQGSNPTTVRSAILANLASYFAVTIPDPDDPASSIPNPLIDFGFNFKDASGNPAGEIAFSDIFNVVRDTSGVRKIGDKYEDFLLNGYDRDVELPIAEFPTLGTVTLINGDTGLAL